MALTLRRRRVREDAARSRPPALGLFYNVTVERVLDWMIRACVAFPFILIALLVYARLHDWLAP